MWCHSFHFSFFISVLFAAISPTIESIMSRRKYTCCLERGIFQSFWLARKIGKQTEKNVWLRGSYQSSFGNCSDLGAFPLPHQVCTHAACRETFEFCIHISFALFVIYWYRFGFIWFPPNELCIDCGKPNSYIGAGWTRTRAWQHGNCKGGGRGRRLNRFNSSVLAYLLFRKNFLCVVKWRTAVLNSVVNHFGGSELIDNSCEPLIFNLRTELCSKWWMVSVV